MIGSGGMFRHLIAEGCKPDAELIAIGDPRTRAANASHQVAYDKFISAKAVLYVTLDRIRHGCMVMAGAIIHAPLGAHCIVGNNAVVSHDVVCGDFVTVGPCAAVCGNATLGEGCFIGAGAIVTPGAVVPPWTLVKAGERWSRK